VTRRRWGFRARLTALIAGVLIIGGAVLLVVQYGFVYQLFVVEYLVVTEPCETTNGLSCSSYGVYDQTTGESVGQWMVSQEQLSSLLLWSILLLASFAGLAVLAAWWLSRRSLARITRIISATRDISRDDLQSRLHLTGPDDEIKELGDTIDGMLDRLSEAFERQDRFIAGASHELRTPLTTTRTLLEIPLEQGRVPDELEPALRGALEANARSERIIAALLVLARGSQAAARGSGQDVDLSEVARAAVADHDAESTTRTVEVDAATTPCRVAADPALVSIAVGNVIENAFRHTPARDGIRITTEATAEASRLVVASGGRRFTAAEVARLIEPFHRGDQTRLASPGTGLGLTLTDTILRAVGGTLTLVPRTQGGITATLTFPRPRPESGPRPRG
jgi:signal transduction histidine kinase